MDFYEVVDQVVKLLQQRGRLTYRSLKVQFKLDDATCEALKDELLFSYPVVDHDGRLARRARHRPRLRTLQAGLVQIEVKPQIAEVVNAGGLPHAGRQMREQAPGKLNFIFKG